MQLKPELGYYYYSPAQNPAWPPTPWTKARAPNACRAIRALPTSARLPCLLFLPPSISPRGPVMLPRHQAFLSHLLLFHLPQKMHPWNHPPPYLPNLLLSPSRTSGVFLGQTPSPTSSAAAPLWSTQITVSQDDHEHTARRLSGAQGLILLSPLLPYHQPIRELCMSPSHTPRHPLLTVWPLRMLCL